MCLIRDVPGIAKRERGFERTQDQSLAHKPGANLRLKTSSRSLEEGLRDRDPLLGRYRLENAKRTTRTMRGSLWLNKTSLCETGDAL